jgi:nucleoside diphosphate kinase
MVGDPDINWAFLTRLGGKVRHYERDVYFREGLRDAAHQWGREWQETLHRSALLMLKPDGLVAGIAKPVYDFLHREGFTVRGVYSVALAGHVWRTLWRFQLTAASTDRFLINEILYQHPGIVLLLRDDRAGPLPAVVRLAELKGSSDPSRQAPTTLRALIKQPHRLFTHIHTPDEPADILREVAVMATNQALRHDMFNSWCQRSMRPPEHMLLEQAFSGTKRHIFHLDSALNRIDINIRKAPVDAIIIDRLLQDLNSIRANMPIDWQRFAGLLVTSKIPMDTWDLLTVGAHAIEVDDPDCEKAIGTPDYAAWRAAPVERQLV